MTTEPEAQVVESARLGIVRFRLGSQTYAAPLSQVVEVVVVESWTRLYRMPAHVLGVLNLRGYICPLLDLGSLLGVPTSGGQVALRARAGQVRDQRVEKPTEAALVVDEVQDVAWIPEDGLAPVPQTVDDRLRPFFSGLIPGSPATLLVDLNQVFRPEYWTGHHG